MSVKIEAQRLMAGKVYRALVAHPLGANLDVLSDESGLRFDQVLAAIGFMRARGVDIGCLSMPEDVVSLYYLSGSILKDVRPEVRTNTEGSGGKGEVSYACKPASMHSFIEVSRNMHPNVLKVLLSCINCKTTTVYAPLKVGRSKKVASYSEAKAIPGLTDVLYRSLLADGHARVGDLA